MKNELEYRRAKHDDYAYWFNLMLCSLVPAVIVTHTTHPSPEKPNKSQPNLVLLPRLGL